MANISKRNRRREREIRNAAKNRREIIAARLSRRDMIKAGLLTSAGYLIQKNGLSARAQFSSDCDSRWRDGSGGNGTPVSPPTTPFVEPLFIPPIAQSVASLSPAPTVAPNTAAGEARTRNHQALTTLPPVKFYEVHQREQLLACTRIFHYRECGPLMERFRDRPMLPAMGNRFSFATSTICQTTMAALEYNQCPLTYTMVIHRRNRTASLATFLVRENFTTSIIRMYSPALLQAIHLWVTSGSQ